MGRPTGTSDNVDSHAYGVRSIGLHERWAVIVVISFLGFTLHIAFPLVGENSEYSILSKHF